MHGAALRPRPGRTGAEAIAEVAWVLLAGFALVVILWTNLPVLMVPVCSE